MIRFLLGFLAGCLFAYHFHNLAAQLLGAIL
jgi:hypothetical protein